MDNSAQEQISQSQTSLQTSLQTSSNQTIKKPLQIPSRPQQSPFLKQISRPIQLISNNFSLKLKGQSKTTFYQYSIETEPQIAKNARSLLNRILKSLHLELKNIFSIYSTRGWVLYSIQDQSDSVSLQTQIEDQTYYIRFKQTNQYDMKQYISCFETNRHNPIVAIINSFVKQILNGLDYLEIGKNCKFYKRQLQNSNCLPQHGIKVWQGFKATVSLTVSSILLQVDFSSRILRDFTVLNYLRQVDCQDRAQSLLIGKQVISNYGNQQIYRIDKVDFTMNPLSSFENREGQKMVIADYYKQKYQIIIRDLTQPLLVHRPKQRYNNNNNRVEYLIPELMNLAGLPDEADPVYIQDQPPQQQRNQPNFNQSSSNNNNNQMNNNSRTFNRRIQPNSNISTQNQNQQQSNNPQVQPQMQFQQQQLQQQQQNAQSLQNTPYDSRSVQQPVQEHQRNVQAQYSQQQQGGLKEVMRDISEFTRIDPNERMKRILNFREEFSQNSQQYNLNVQESSQKVNGVLLSQPELEMNQKTIQPDENGRFNLRDVVCQPAYFKDWIVIYASRGNRDDNDVDNFINTLFKCAQTYGILLDNPFSLKMHNLNSRQWVDELQRNIEQYGKPQIVVSLIPSAARNTIYPQLKELMCVKLGVPHQNVVLQTLKNKGIMSICSKILLQMNAKIGKTLWMTPALPQFSYYQQQQNNQEYLLGQQQQQSSTQTIINPEKFNACEFSGNYQKEQSQSDSCNTTMSITPTQQGFDLLAGQDERIMIVGIDVYHKLIHNKNSCLGFVASLDSRFTNFYSRVTMQPPGSQLFQNLSMLIKDAVLRYFEYNGKQFFPDKIIFYRDGISANLQQQIKILLQTEVEAILRGFKLVNEDYSPKCAYIIINKKNSNRFFQFSQRQSKNNQNQNYYQQQNNNQYSNNQPYYQQQSIHRQEAQFQQNYNQQYYYDQQQLYQQFDQQLNLQNNNYNNSQQNIKSEIQYSNPPSGTIVAETQEFSKVFDFYLCAQSVAQGTCTPSHYTVIYNTTEFTEDTFWTLTYYQCFNYFNWSGAVRVPAPTQYAHKLAQLVGETLQSDTTSKNLSDKLFYL